jgi:hypothetical protein
LHFKEFYLLLLVLKTILLVNITLYLFSKLSA